ncbi:MAG TPA: 4Fe-4S dicluster domain-containing protein [Anaerolineales bacterium]|nr:4Fe-4S dicluster domain-containing protein [Anaerolineales bacterium]
MYFITRDVTKCVVCRNCEYACALRQAGDFNRENSNIRVDFYDDVKICLPMTCLQCDDAWCLEVCPAAAIQRNDATGAVEIHSERCVGCKMCSLACPFGNIHFDNEHQVSRKCDMCQGEPACVKFCISGALQYTTGEISYQNNREIFQRFIDSFRDEENSGTGNQAA